MSKFVPDPQSPDTLPRVRGSLLTYARVDGFIAQRWPRKRPGWKNTPMKDWCIRFGFAGKIASNPMPLDQVAAEGLAVGTFQVPRDFLTMAATGRLWILENPDGTVWGHVPGPTVPSATPTAKANRMWEWFNWTSPRNTGYSAGGGPTRGNTLVPDAANTLDSVRAVAGFVAGSPYRVIVAELDGAYTIVSMVTSPEIVPGISGNQVIEFALNAPLKAATTYAIMLNKADAADTDSLPVYYTTTNEWLHTSTAPGNCGIGKANPAIGDTVYHNAGYWFPLACSFQQD